MISDRSRKIVRAYVNAAPIIAAVVVIGWLIGSDALHIAIWVVILAVLVPIGRAYRKRRARRHVAQK
jgi:hypothetical protein